MRRLVFVAATVVAALSTTAGVFAGGGPPPGGGGGGGGETTLGNNLSVPATFVPGTTGAPALRVACTDAPRAPGDDGALPSTQFPGYWLQKTEATWSASCATAASATVTAEWGANLTDAPSVAAGKPVRVEVGLLDVAAAGTGYTITNLTPTLADRLATYGTDGTSFTSGVDGAPFTRVWGPGTTLAIENLGTSVTTTVPITAEINSTGAVVYGYNWGSKGSKNTPSAGQYRLTFTIDPAITIGAVVPGAVNSPTVGVDGHSTSLMLTLTPANRGGGGGGGN